MVVGDQRHAPAALLLGKRPGSNCTGERVGHRPVWNDAEKLAPPTGIRFSDRSVSNKSLC